MSALQTKTRDLETQVLSSLHKCRFTFRNGVEGRSGYFTCEKRCFLLWQVKLNKCVKAMPNKTKWSPERSAKDRFIFAA